MTYLLTYLSIGATLWATTADRLPIAERCAQDNLNPTVIWWLCCIGFAIVWLPLCGWVALCQIFDGTD